MGGAVKYVAFAGQRLVPGPSPPKVFSLAQMFPISYPECIWSLSGCYLWSRPGCG